jgi:hypothetical protein
VKSAPLLAVWHEFLKPATGNLPGRFPVATNDGYVPSVRGYELPEVAASTPSAYDEGQYRENEEYDKEDLRHSHERAGNSSKSQDCRDERDHKASNG